LTARREFKLIKLVEYFHTFQGEGMNWGRRAFFVRIPFCNLSCSWCDTEFNKFERVEAEEFIKAAESEPCRFAVITGGEPAMSKETPKIIKILKDLKFEIAIESNGTFPIPDGIDFVTLSPKAQADFEMHPQAIRVANEIKVVVDEGFDTSILNSIEKLSDEYVRLSLSPEWGNKDASLKIIEEFIKENPKWRISLQTHKIMGVR